MLNQYQSDCIEAHEPHTDPGDFSDQNDPMCPRFDNDDCLKRCCGQDRPGSGPCLELVAKKGHFISIGDYINTVHTWLRGMDDLLRAAEGVVSCRSLEVEHHLMVPVFSFSFSFSCLLLESAQT